MSACISSQGEYSDHKTNKELWCDRCFAYDDRAVDVMVAENERLRKVAEAAGHREP